MVYYLELFLTVAKVGAIDYIPKGIVILFGINLNKILRHDL